MIGAWEAFGIHQKPMRKVAILRDPSTPLGTFGILTAGAFSCYSLELNDHANAKEISCIPLGKYLCKLVSSPKFGAVYGVMDVSGRENILIHKGNFGADEGHGKRDIEGCILIGNAIGEIGGQACLLSSKDAFNRFMAEMEGEPFELTIERKA